MVIQREVAGTLADFGALRGDHWATRTLCPDWDALDLLVHLALGTELHLNMLRNGLADRFVSPFDVSVGPDPRAHFRRLSADQRAAGPDATLARLRVACGGYLAALEPATDADLARPAWFWGTTAPLGEIIAIRAFDFAIHRADIRLPLGITPGFDPATAPWAAGVTAATMGWFYTAIPDAPTGAVDLVIGDQVSRATLADGGVTVGAPGEAAAEATVTTEPEAFILAVWGRFPVATLEERGALRIAGEVALARALFAGVRMP